MSFFLVKHPVPGYDALVNMCGHIIMYDEAITQRNGRQCISNLFANLQSVDLQIILNV